MKRYRSADHNLTSWTSWEPEREGERINDHIVMSRSNSHSYLVTTEDGDLVINTGTAYQGARHRERFEQVIGRALDVRRIIFTQSHPDHIGGWGAFNGPRVETIAQSAFHTGIAERKRLQGFFAPRTQRLMGKKIGFDDPVRRRAYLETPWPEITAVFDDTLSFEQGGRRFELFSAPGGETRDGLAVWLPDERVVFTGNLMGALFPQFPHLATLRGDRPRSAVEYITCVDRLLALEPELLITGHDLPIAGEDRVRFELTRLRDATQFIHDNTLAGMNEGKDLWTLMREVQLPPELRVGPNRGPLSWYVRTVWEEYVGWFRFESTTELYGVPPRSVWPELCELAGGADVLAARALEHVEAGRPLEALHLTDIALVADAGNERALRAELAAMEVLLDRSGGENFDEVRWLESEIERIEERLAQPPDIGNGSATLPGAND